MVNGLLNKGKKSLPAHDSAQDLSNDFAAYFTDKIKTIYIALTDGQIDNANDQSSPTVHNSSKLSEFEKLSENDVLKMINKAPSKSCALDPVPSWFMKQNIDSFVPSITQIINESLSTGIFPTSLKNSIITPLIKKPSLDPNNFKNYRPVSNLSFISKLIEKHACVTLTNHINKHCLAEELQSAYKQAHSTETALMKVKDDILTRLAQRQGVFLVLLDLSSAFDTISHDILMDRLFDLGVRDRVLQWFKSYLSNRPSRVCINGVFSEPQTSEIGLPQGSIVGPLGFTIYVLPVGRIIR